MDGLYHKWFFKCCMVIPTGPWTARAHAGKGSKGKGRHAVKTRSRARGKPSSQVRLRVHCIGSLICRPTRPAHGSDKCTCSAFGLDTCPSCKGPVLHFEVCLGSEGLSWFAAISFEPTGGYC